MPPAITEVWNTILVWPIEGALVALTQLTGSAGLAIIVFTVVVRTVLLPLGIKQARSQKAMAALGPQIKDLQKRYAGDRAKQVKGGAVLRRAENVAPSHFQPHIARMPSLFTIGYEQARSPAVIEELKRAGVGLVVDTRAVAASRRPGFSKRQLAAGLDEAGIAYLHLQKLGTPKEGREAARSGNLTRLFDLYEKHIATPDAAAACVTLPPAVKTGE